MTARVDDLALDVRGPRGGAPVLVIGPGPASRGRGYGVTTASS